MIPTPLYSENPKGWTRAENFDEGDGIPIEKGSGFGNHITRDVMTASIVISYIEITASTTVDVSARYSDLHLRIVGAGEGIVTTVTGQLPQGRRLHMDVQAAANASTLIIGGVTYELPAGGGVLTFVSTSDGWSAPLKMEFDLRVANELTVDGEAHFNGGISPKSSTEAYAWEKITLGASVRQLVPRGFHLVRGGGSARVIVSFRSEGVTPTYVSLAKLSDDGVCFVPSDGIHYWMENTHFYESTDFFFIKL